MKFRDYCIIVMGKTSGCRVEIDKVAQTTPNYLEAKGITIATFVSALEPNELTEFFKSFNRSFIILDLDESSSGFNITNNQLHNKLFGHISRKDHNELEEMTNRLMDEITYNNDISGNTKINFIRTNVSEPEDIIEEFDEMSKTEKEELMNEILDKGLENLTDHDRKILEKLTKNS